MSGIDLLSDIEKLINDFDNLGYTLKVLGLDRSLNTNFFTAKFSITHLLKKS